MFLIGSSLYLTVGDAACCTDDGCTPCVYLRRAEDMAHSLYYSDLAYFLRESVRCLSSWLRNLKINLCTRCNVSGAC